MRNEEKFWKKYFYIKSKNNIFLTKLYKYELLMKMRKYNSSIAFESNIKSKIKLPHGLSGIFISRGAVIGENCTIFHQVTIGSNTLSDSKGVGAPVIGNNCYIGVGAKIIGNVKVGNNVRIGANCVVVKDVPDNATVVCAENRVILHKEKRNNNFVKYDDIKNNNKF